MVEMLTVVGVIGVLATLMASGLAGSKTRSRQTMCTANLHQITVAVTTYGDDTGRRPRSLTRLAQRPSWLANRAVLLCPSDPALRRKTEPGQPVKAWGNQANASQEPSSTEDIGEPESGTWQAEIAEKQETLPFSVLHPLAWPKRPWQALTAQGNQSGDVACELHGVRVPPGSAGGERPLYMDYEGRTLRGQRDGAVVSRKVFHDFAVQPGATTATPSSTQGYPWELYTDNPPARL